MDIRVIRGGDGNPTPHSGTSFADRRHELRVILGGKYVSPIELQLRDKIQEIYKEADEENQTKVAGILLATYRIQTRQQWVYMVLSAAAGAALQALIYRLFF